jgi:hypothetical protein
MWLWHQIRLPTDTHSPMWSFFVISTLVYFGLYPLWLFNWVRYHYLIILIFKHHMLFWIDPTPKNTRLS